MWPFTGGLAAPQENSSICFPKFFLCKVEQTAPSTRTYTNVYLMGGPLVDLLWTSMIRHIERKGANYLRYVGEKIFFCSEKKDPQ